MLLSYSFSNFGSVAEPTAVSLTLNQRDTADGWHRISPSGQRASTALAVLGANGAGKTTLIRAGFFLFWFMHDSFSTAPDAAMPFAQHAALTGLPSDFEMEGDDDQGVRWRYVLSATPQRVLHEALYRKGKRMGYVFERRWNDLSQSYDVKQQGLGLADSEAAKVRPNVSLIAWARQYGVDLNPYFGRFFAYTNLAAYGRVPNHDNMMWEAAAYFNDNPARHDQMRDLIRAWDLGLSDVRLQRYERPTGTGMETQTSWFPMGVHHSAGSVFELPFSSESSGTQTALLLLWRLLPALAGGGIAFIDELENDLHPHMIEPLLRLFHDPDSNPLGAQVVFTCQSPEVLRLLQRAQVVFVEKEDCQSTAYRGDEIAGLTSAQNLYGKYMAGALGAVPQL